MKAVGKQIAAMALILVLICLVCRVAVGNTYVAHLPVRVARPVEGGMRLSIDEAGVVEAGEPQRRGDYVRIPIRPGQPGEVMLSVGDDVDSYVASSFFRVGPLGTIYDVSSGGFTGDWIVLFAVTFFFLAVTFLMLRFYRRTKGPAFYSYATIYAVGFGLFCLVTGLNLLNIALRHVVSPGSFSMLSAYGAISGAGWQFVMLTAPFMLCFALAMAVSNVELLRHEHFRPQNVLGIGAALLLIAGEALCFWLASRNFMGSEWEYRVRNTLENSYATVFSYFECMLLGAIVCGLKAARHVPAQDRDCLVILGCRFRKDGTLPPLLRGRVDRAIEFWRAQKAATGREALLIPSGGQGPDESMPEAEAMRRYLVEQGIPEERIRPEVRSRNTYENMEYSRALIEAECEKPQVAYVTTNYHVFRSGVWAGLAGLPAEGIGSRTKWWFWPNAFMRECAGLLKNRLKLELMLLLVMLAFFGLLSMVLY